MLLTGGDPVNAGISLFADHLGPSLQSEWKLGAITFTFILGGFAAILEAGGGFAVLMGRVAGRTVAGRNDASSQLSDRSLETAAAGLGILCFFDGLANSMVVGRVSRDLADRAGTARVKLAYIVDSTSSAVACVAFVSTWIAFQLSMISEAYELAGRTVNPYAVFLESLPYNFYCWFTLVLLFVAVRKRFHPGPVARFVREATLKTIRRAGEPQGMLSQQTQKASHEPQAYQPSGHPRLHWLPWAF